MRIPLYALLLCSVPIMVHAQSETDSVHHSYTLSTVNYTILGQRHQKNYTRSRELQQSTDRLLERIPGVTMIRRGNFAMEPTLRGLSAAQINMTIDGMQLFGACTDRMDPISSYVEPNNMERIQLAFSPDGEQHNASVGGGLDFRLKQAQTGAVTVWSGLVGAGYETNASATQTIAALQYSRSRFAISANGVWRRAGNYTAGKGQEIAFSQYNKWNLGLSAVYLLKPNQQLRVDYLQDEGYNIGYPALTMDVSFAKAKIGSASYIYTPTGMKLKSWESKVYYNYIDHAMDDTKRPAWQVPIHMDMPGTSQTMGLYSRAKWYYTNHFLEGQFTAYSNRLHAEMTMYPKNAAEMFMLTLPDVQRTVYGIDLKDKIYLGRDWTLSPSLTVNYVQSSIYTELGKETLSSLFTGALDRKNLIWNAGLNAEKHFNGGWTLFGQLSRGARSASAQELYAFYLFNRMDNFDYIGNKDLKQETSVNASLGMSYHSQKLHIQPQLFVYRFSNYIVGQRKQGYSTMTIGASGVKQYINIPDALLYGGELYVTYRPWDKWYIQSTNSISIGQDNAGNALPLIPPFKSINRIEYTPSKYGFYAESISQSRQGRVSTAVYGERASMGFTIFNVGAGRNFMIGKNTLNVHAAVYNILDKQYYEHLDILKLYRPGRNVALNLSLTF